MGAFIFWLIWPYVITRVVGRAYLRFTGRALPKTQQAKLRRDLAKITRAIMKPNQPDKEPVMPKTASTSFKVGIASGAGVAVGIVIGLVAISAAFRVPTELKRFLPKPR